MYIEDYMTNLRRLLKLYESSGALVIVVNYETIKVNYSVDIPNLAGVEPARNFMLALYVPYGDRALQTDYLFDTLDLQRFQVGLDDYFRSHIDRMLQALTAYVCEL